MSEHRCKYCDSPLRRKKYETQAVFASRDYCQQPRCLAKGRESELYDVYSKEQDAPTKRLHEAQMTRTLFLYRWGMEAMDAADNYGKEATEDFYHVHQQVREGKAVEIKLNIDVLNSEGDKVGTITRTERMLLPDPLTEGAAENLAKSIARGAVTTMLEFAEADLLL